jgi:MoaA/NifB/PqqE/SkfB family radical SAM enzyme
MFSRTVLLHLFQPGKLKFYSRILTRQKLALKRRNLLLGRGETVPGIIILSTTRQCNLNCTGCYNHYRPVRPPGKGLHINRISYMFREACDMGTGIIILAGGEPFLRMDILERASGFSQIIFPVFTNGTLLDEEKIRFLKDNPHIIPILSLEGTEAATDIRRGEGLYGKVMKAAEALKRNRIFYGVSVTLTRHNTDDILDGGFVPLMLSRGARTFFFVEYTPAGPQDASNCLSENQKKKVSAKRDEFQKRKRALFINLPGDEESYGGCLAAGRGFIHISPEGDLEPCPFAPFSAANIAECTLKEALSSDFIRTLRENRHLLGESRGGCTLWNNREWVARKLESSLSTG